MPLALKELVIAGGGGTPVPLKPKLDTPTVAFELTERFPL
jgi:hypothetical protein